MPTETRTRRLFSSCGSELLAVSGEEVGDRSSSLATACALAIDDENVEDGRRVSWLH